MVEKGCIVVKEGCAVVEEGYAFCYRMGSDELHLSFEWRALKALTWEFNLILIL